MLKPPFTTKLSDAEITRIVTETLPRWRAACDHPSAEAVIMHRGEFKDSPDELLLMGIAIKYAGLAKKTVMIYS